MTVVSQSQKLSISDGLVELFVLDCSQIGGSIHYFTPNTEVGGSGPVLWRSQLYFPMPITTDGWEYSGDGAQKTPSLQVSNVTKALLNAVIQLGDIVGAKVTRYRTFANFLDEGSTPDPTQFMRPETFIISQKTSHDKTTIAWSLCSMLDRAGIRLPRRQITKEGDSRWGGFPGVGQYTG